MMRSEVSSPFSNLEVIEKHEENQTGARERNLTSSVNSTAIIVLARWDLLSYPQAYRKRLLKAVWRGQRAQ